MPRTLRVLLVEDCSTDAELMLLELRRAGFEPEWERVETEAEYSASLLPELDVILCDCSKPGFSGLRALDVLRSRGLDIPLIFVSGTLTEDTAVAAMQQGAADYIVKDRLRRLGPAVALALDKRRLRKEGEQTEKALEHSNSLLNAALESTADGILVVDMQGKIVSHNQKFLDMWRIPSSLATSLDDDDLLHFVVDQIEDPETFLAKVEDLYRNPQDCSWDELQFLDGRCIERYSQPQRLGGAIVGRVWSFRDITERKRAEETLRQTNERVRHLNSVLYAIHDVGHVLNSKKNSRELLTAVCQSLIKTRGYLTVWVGEPEPKSMRVLPAAHSGAGDMAFLDHAPITWDDTPYGQGPTGTAIRERRAVVFEDIAHDPRFAPWRDDVIANGIASIASIPILHEERLFGTLTIKADKANAFDDEEVALLSRLAADVGRALRNIEEEAARRKAEEAHARLATAVEQAHESIVITDVKGDIQYVNPFAVSVSGYTKEELIGQNPRIFKSGKHTAKFYREMWNTLACGQVWRGRITNKRKDGTLYEEDATISPIVDAAGRTVSYVAVKRDVSREVQLEAQFRQIQNQAVTMSMSPRGNSP